jgi:class 3 adenylate cyclase/predicted ATPase
MEPQGRRHTERKRVTVVFADVVGFSTLSEARGPEEAYLVVTGCLKLLDGIARKHGGSVDRYLGDCLMAVFGHPVPLEDAAGAATQTALEMRQRVHDYGEELRLARPLEIHIGVNTGSVVVGDIRGPVIREFHVLGDAVNVAARLKARSPLGAIYVGPDTEAETRERFEYRALEPMALKGKSVAIATHELVRARTAGPRRIGSDHIVFSELVGRERELALLRESLARVVRGEGGIVSLCGEDGSGKSRLIAELVASEEARTVALLEARSLAGGREQPLHSFESLRRGLAELVGPEDAVRPPANPETLIRQRLVALAQTRPVAIVCEDVQWADPASIGLLGELLSLAEQHPIVFLLVSRPGSAESAGRLLEQARRAHGDRLVEVSLGPLAREDRDRLIDAIAGEERLSAEARALIEERAGGNPLRIVLGVFLAPALRSERDRAREGHDRSSEAERRRATVLFADITGFTRLTETLGDEEAYGHVAGALALLDEVARKYGGTVDKYLGDCVLALFGVPAAIEDAPRAAVNAAIEMRQRIREFSRERGLAEPLDVHCGINTGLGIAGDVSGPLLREFAVMGEPVEVADRLKDIAPAGHIHVGHDTYRLTAKAFEYAACEPIPLEGRAERVPTWDLLSDQPQLHRRRVGADREIFSELVGREAELAQLRASVTRAARGEGGVVGLVGEAGLGKSRLVAELRTAAEAAGARWLEGRSISIGQQLSFHPFGDLLRAWARITDQDAADAVPAKLEEAVARLFPDEADEMVSFLGALMGLRLSEHHRARLEAVQGEVMEKLIRRSVTELLRRVSEEAPLVLVFDDLHWADLSSIELLESLLRLPATQPIVFLLVCRPDFVGTSGHILDVARRQHAECFAEIRLEPLGPDAARLLINNLFRNAEIPHAVRALIVEKSRGNPFYVEEVVRSLIEQGAVESQDGGFRATERIHAVVIPDTVHEVIMARVDRLDLHKKQLLQIASVIGGSFHREVLLEIFPDKDALDADLQLLVDADFLVPWDRLQGVEFAFKHPLIQEVTYDALLQAKREELHLRVAKAIEVTLTENVPGYLAMLAYHFSLGCDPERAEEYLFRAGDESARSAASNEALHFFRKASELYLSMHGEGGDPAKKARLERNIGLALYNRGQLGDAASHFDRALRHLGQRVPSSAVVLSARFAFDMISILAQLYLTTGRRNKPPATPSQREIIDVMFRRGLSQTTTAPTRFVYDSMATLRRLSTVDPRTVPNAGGMYAGAVGIFSYGGVSFPLGRRFLDIARDVIDAAGAPELHLYYRVLNFIHHFLTGDWSKEHEIDDAVLQENLRGGRLWEVTTYVALAAEKYLRQGLFAAARERTAEIDRIWESYDYEPAKLNHHVLRMYHALEQRRLADAERAADVYYEENPQDLLHVLALGSKAEAQILAGETDAADATVTRGAGALARAGRGIPYHTSGYLGARLHLDLVRLEAAAGGSDRAQWRIRRGLARRSAKAALAIASKAAYHQPPVFRWNASRLWLELRHAEALRWWARSLEVGRRLGLRPEVARTCQEVGLRLGDGRYELEGRGSAAFLDEARRTFSELGLEWDLARLERRASP